MKPSSSARPHRVPRGYSLIELVLASGLLATGLAAAASLTLTSTKIEEMNHHKARCLALAEASATLWQLGLSEAEIKDQLLGDPHLVLGNPNPSPATPFFTAGPDPTTPAGATPTIDTRDMTQDLSVKIITVSVKMDETATQPLQPITAVQSTGF